MNQPLDNKTFKVKDCVFCSISESTAIADEILYETPNFYVVTAVGCFVENYIMIVSKLHLVSMCYIEDCVKGELIELINKFKNVFWKKYGFWPVVFEHGASNCDTNKGGCCVLHAHVHMVPHKLNNWQEIVKKLELTKIDKYDYFFNIAYNKPYLFFVNNDDEIFLRILVDSVIPSQIIRRWIAKDLKMAEKWDWRQYPFDENIVATVESMKLLVRY